MVVVVVYVAVVGEGGRLLLLEVGLVVEEEAEEKLTPYLICIHKKMDYPIYIIVVISKIFNTHFLVVPSFKTKLYS